MTINRLFKFFFCFLFLSTFQMLFPQNWDRVYLATFPRSGNHWIRYLVEEASYIATSSVYCDPDPPHLKKVFPWGGYSCDHGYEGHCRYPNENDFVLVKTHFPGQNRKMTQFDCLPAQTTIRIVRHPVDSFYSCYTEKYLREGKEPAHETVPTNKVKDLIKRWHRFQTYWNNKKNVLTIRYEDVLENPFVELKRICKVLNYKVTDEDIERAISKHPPQGYVLKSINKFKHDDLKLISKELHDLMTQFDYSIP